MNNVFNFKSFFKFLSRNKAYTAIDVIGLSVSLMFVILIAVYTKQELSVDNFQKNTERVYILGDGDEWSAPFRLAHHLQERYPEVEKVCPLTTCFYGKVVSSGEQRMNADLLLADTTFFDFFTCPLITGDPHQALLAKNSAVISETFANKMFADKDPMGQSILVGDSVIVTVSGVMKDIKNSVIPTCDLLIRMDQVKYFNPNMDSESFRNAGSSVIFVMAKEGADLQARTDDMAGYFKEIFWTYQRGISDKVTFTPFNEIYFSDMSGYLLRHGDWRFVMILFSIGILILCFAIINYINLTVAQTAFRAKEMATRRLMGSSRGELFVRLIFESILLTFVSFLLGLFLAVACVPYANTLLESRIFIEEAVTPLNIGICVGLVAVLGILSGLLPALLISNMKPIDVVRGTFRQKTKMVFSKVFITFQNVITIALVASSITMVAQINHLINAPLGYNTTNVLDVSAGGMEDKAQVMTFINELKGLACVTRIGQSEGTPFDRGNNWTTEYEDRNISFQILRGDTAYLHILGLQILRENHLTSDLGYYLSEQALLETGLTEEAISFKLGKHQFPIAGVVKDIQLGNITYSNSPLLLQIVEDDQLEPWNILVEVTGDPFEAHEQVKQVYERLTRLDFHGKYIDQWIEESFASQQRTAKMVSVFSIIAILISLLGLLAMSTYFIQQRSSEVAVRKVFGSSNKEILFKLVFTFLNYVLIAFVISIPVIWYFMKNWLSGYSYHIELSPFIFIAAGLFCLLISFITVFWQSYRAANTNPVNSVKDKF